MSNTTISEAQLKANHLNAQKSTGPKTESGKENAKFNARRHGLTGQFYCMSEGDEKAYLEFQTKMLADLKPTAAYESQLAISVIQDHWRLNRSRGVEFNLIGQGHDQHAEEVDAPSPNVQASVTMARTWQSEDRRIANLALYETRLHRIIVKNEKRLKELQDERESREAKARREAELLARLALMRGDSLETVGFAPADPNPTDATAEPPYLPTELKIHVHGFVFSAAEILASLERKEHLREAEFFETRDWNRSINFPDSYRPYPLAA